MGVGLEKNLQRKLVGEAGGRKATVRNNENVMKRKELERLIVGSITTAGFIRRSGSNLR